MDDLSKFKESLLNNIHTLVFNELSKLQIEEKYLERQAQSLIEHALLTTDDPDLKEKIKTLIEDNDPDFDLESDVSIGDIDPKEFAYIGED